MTARKAVTVIGAGLAGCEAAWQLAERDIEVTLIEMKPTCRSGAHALDGMAELVCSNSFRAAGTTSAVGLLKEELRRLGAMLIHAADKTAVPAGRALAVDRTLFSKTVEAAVLNHPRIRVERRRADELPRGRTVLASGPLTEGPLTEALGRFGALLSYHDAIAPLVSKDGLDFSKIFAASRYEDPAEDGAYLNCPFDAEQYRQFVEALVSAQRTPLRDFETAPFFEGCLPVEELADRGFKTLAFGPLKPVGLTDPATGRRPYAAVQLRRENLQGDAFNLVGFQTRLTRPEQRRVFRMIPGMENASFERYGQVHRNSFVNAPEVLDEQLRLRGNLEVSIAGQLCGVEGYVESIAAGFAAAWFVFSEITGRPFAPFPSTCALGGLLRYLQIPQKNFQPSNVVWAMIDTPPRGRQGKRPHREAAAKKALLDLAKWKENHFVPFQSGD